MWAPKVSRGFKSHPVRTKSGTDWLGFSPVPSQRCCKGLLPRSGSSTNPTPSVLRVTWSPDRMKSPLGGVAERQCTGLENRRPQGLKGSNPFPSAPPRHPSGILSLRVVSHLTVLECLAALHGESLPLRSTYARSSSFRVATGTGSGTESTDSCPNTSLPTLSMYVPTSPYCGWNSAYCIVC